MTSENGRGGPRKFNRDFFDDLENNENKNVNNARYNNRQGRNNSYADSYDGNEPYADPYVNPNADPYVNPNADPNFESYDGNDFEDGYDEYYDADEFASDNFENGPAARDRNYGNRANPGNDRSYGNGPRESGYANRGSGSGRRTTAVKQANKQQQRRKTTILILAFIAIALVAALVFYMTLVRPNENYDSQMRLGVKHYNAGEYEEAEIAFKKALEYRPNDADATVALSDTYIASSRFDEALPLLTGLQSLSPEDARTYNRLITLYVKNYSDIPKANEQIKLCLEGEINPENDLVVAGPVIEPNGGEYDEVTSVAITAAEGATIYYTLDGSIPSEESKKYKKKVKLSKNQKTVLTAISVAENGLLSWTSNAEFTIEITLIVNSEPLDNIGATAATIMNREGPLFYAGDTDGGFYYKTEDARYYYVFPAEAFTVSTPEPAETTTDSTVPATGEEAAGGEATEGEAAAPTILDPNKTPLPGNAVAVAVSMEISEYILQMPSTMPVEDFAQGLGIKDYEVTKVDSSYHLTYKEGGKNFDYTLSDKNTVSSKKNLLVKR